MATERAAATERFRPPSLKADGRRTPRLATKTLEYHIPTLGPIRARFFPLASQCYGLLDGKGHTDRLRKIDQLGVIRHVFEGAHHSR